MTEGEYTEKEIETQVMYRTLSLSRDDGAVDKDTRTVSLSFSSETPVQRYFGNEILDHSAGSIRTGFIASGSAPLLFNHNPGDQLGVIKNVSFSSDRGGRGTVRFGRSARAEEKLADVEDGILTNVSVGYIVHAYEETVDAAGVATARVVDWEPLEVSLVTIPADASVGVGRFADLKVKTKVRSLSEPVPDHKSEPNSASEEERSATEEVVETLPSVEATEEDTVSENKTPALTDEERNAAIKAVREGEQSRVSGLTSLGEQYGCRDKAQEFIREGKTPENLKDFILDKGYRKAETVTDKVDMTDKETKRYSIMKAVRAVANRDWTNAGLEREVSQTLAKRFGEARGLWVPSDILMKRDITKGGTADGAALVGTDHRPDLFIEFLRPRLVFGDLGIQVMGGLVGDVHIPRQTSGTTVGWVDVEGSPSGESNLVTDALTLSPKTARARTDITRTMLLQSSPAVEALVINDMNNALAQEVTRIFFEGDGSSNRPTGVKSASGVQTVVSGSPCTNANVISLETLVAAANADVGNMGYVTTSHVRGNLKGTFANATYGEIPVWRDDNTLNGYAARVFNGFTVFSNPIIFGNFGDGIIAQWGGIDITVDPYTNGDSGGHVLRMFFTCDTALRHGASFAYTVPA